MQWRTEEEEPAPANAVEGESAEKAPAAEEQPAAKGPAADAAAENLGEGRLIRVRLPLTDNGDTRIISAIQRVVDQLSRLPLSDDRRPTLILELSPQRDNTGSGEGTNFTRALSLARFLTSGKLSAVKTVAYIPRTIKGHGVLIALACDQIAIAPGVELGEAAIDEDSSRAIDPTIVNTYKEIVAAKRTVPLAVALGMIDRKLEVLKVETDQGTEFVLAQRFGRHKKNRTIVSQDVDQTRRFARHLHGP